MHRTSLASDHGMLFVFDHEAPLTFWMKNTLIPLDIIYFAHDGSFVSSTTMVPCTGDPCTIYPSRAPASYALEVPAGFLQQHPVDAQWKLIR